MSKGKRGKNEKIKARFYKRTPGARRKGKKQASVEEWREECFVAKEISSYYVPSKK